MTIRRIGILFASAIIGFGILSGAFTADAHHAVLRFNLEEMTATADRILVGRCVAVEETEEFIAQGNMPVTRYTFEVERAIKGLVPKLMVFRQLGHPARRALGKGGEMTMHGRVVTPATFIHGMSEYRVGDRMVLFLIRNYLDGKVTYPVGLYQGAFLISRMASGQELVRNSINNLGLFTAPYNGTSMSDRDARMIFPQRDQPLSDALDLSIKSKSLAERRGALPLDAFLEMVERLNVLHGGDTGAIVSNEKGASLQ